MRVAALMMLTLLLACVSGCGYRVGSLMHPQIRTVAVAPVVNETIAYNVSAEVRGLLCEAFMTDGSLKLVDMSKADCIVYARVLGVNFSEISWATKSNDFDVPNQWAGFAAHRIFRGDSGTGQAAAHRVQSQRFRRFPDRRGPGDRTAQRHPAGRLRRGEKCGCRRHGSVVISERR